MMTTLHLTAEEKELFEKLSEELRDGWTVEEEVQTFEDTPQKAQIRLRLLRIHDPKLLAFVEEAKGAKNADELAKLLGDMDLSGVAETEIGKLFFALGPGALGNIVESLLKQAKKDKDVEDIVAITTIRYELLASLQSA